MKGIQMASIAASLLMAAAVQAQQSSSLEIKDSEVEVKLEFVDSPRIGADNVAAVPGSGSNANSQKWLEALVVYTMPSIQDPKGKQPLWVDDMNLSVRILYPAEFKGERVTAIMTGKSVFMSVPCDGKKHRATLYVPPVVIQRYGSPEAKINKTGAKDLFAMVLFQTKQQTSIGGGVQVPRGSSKQAVINAFKEVDNRLNILRLEDSVLSRDQTPWRDLDFDSFDMLKPLGSK